MIIFFKKLMQIDVVFWGLIMLLIGLFYSRALLSISSIILICFLLLHKPNLFINKWLSFAIISIILLPFLSILWSINKQEALEKSLVKLPLLLLLLPCYFKLSVNKMVILVKLLTLFCLIACTYTIANYYFNYTLINEAYLQAKVMPTALDNDHIRFSWLVVLTMLCIGRVMQLPQKPLLHTILLLVQIFLFFFLHLLASKTGLLCLYAALLVLLIKYFKTNYLKGLFISIIGIAFFIICYNYIPSLHNRIQYILYDFSQYSNGHFITGLSDGARILSCKAGWYILNENPFFGVGFGDVFFNVKNWHLIQHPNALPYEIFLPTNQFLIYGAATGFLGMVVFFVSILYILKMLFVKNIFSIITAMVLIIPLITDDSFEGQFGVTIFVLFYIINVFLNKQEKLLNKTIKL